MKCPAIKPGPAGYAPITWTYCTQDRNHYGDHSGPLFGYGPRASWPNTLPEQTGDPA